MKYRYNKSRNIWWWSWTHLISAWFSRKHQTVYTINECGAFFSEASCSKRTSALIKGHRLRHLRVMILFYYIIKCVPVSAWTVVTPAAAERKSNYCCRAHTSNGYTRVCSSDDPSAFVWGRAPPDWLKFLHDTRTLLHVVTSYFEADKWERGARKWS